jgi:hypothetical protein
VTRKGMARAGGKTKSGGELKAKAKAKAGGEANTEAETRALQVSVPMDQVVGKPFSVLVFTSDAKKAQIHLEQTAGSKPWWPGDTNSSSGGSAKFEVMISSEGFAVLEASADGYEGGTATVKAWA